MWFNKSVADTLQQLEVDPSKGLGEAEVEAKLKQFGPNRLEGMGLPTPQYSFQWLGRHCLVRLFQG